MEVFVNKQPPLVLLDGPAAVSAGLLHSEEDEPCRDRMDVLSLCGSEDAARVADPAL